MENEVIELKLYSEFNVDVVESVSDCGDYKQAVAQTNGMTLTFNFYPDGKITFS